MKSMVVDVYEKTGRKAIRFVKGLNDLEFLDFVREGGNLGWLYLCDRGSGDVPNLVCRYMNNFGECEWCGTETDKLTRYVDGGGGLNIVWVCKYCDCDKAQGRDDSVSSVAAMSDVLEKTIPSKIIFSS